MNDENWRKLRFARHALDAVWDQCLKRLAGDARLGVSGWRRKLLTLAGIFHI